MRILVSSVVDINKTAHNRIHQFIKHLSRNHEIVVISINDFWKMEQANVLAYVDGLEDACKVDLRYLTADKISPIIQEIFSCYFSRKALKGCDVSSFDVHFAYNALFLSNAIAKKVNKHGIPTVYDLADDLPSMIDSSPQLPKPLRRLGYHVGNYLIRRNIALSSKVTVINTILSEMISNKKNVEVVPNGVDTEMFQFRIDNELKNKLDVNECFVIGYVGVLREWVDLGPVMKAVKNINQRRLNVKFVIVGEEGNLAYYKRLTRDLEMQDLVVFTGTVPYKDVPRYISCMDVCAIPFKLDAVAQNSLPLKLFEYMACNRPVISTPIKGIRNVMPKELIAYYHNVSELESEIMKLIQNRNKVKMKEKEYRKFVENNYSWASICSKLEELLILTKYESVGN